MSKAKAQPVASIPAVAYLRMSDKKQDASIPAQRAEIERYAAANGYCILRWYADEGISGAENAKRVAFQKMILDAQDLGDFRAIIVWDQDRFSRFDPVEANYYWHILRQAGVQIATVATGVLDFSDLGGWLTASVAQHGKAQYLKDLSRNVLRGRLNKARKGKWQHNRAPFGYAIVNNGDLIEGETADVVRRIFGEYADSETSLWNIAAGLNADSIPAPGSQPARKGKPAIVQQWKSSAVREVLRRECYVTGKASQLRTPKGKFNAVVDGEIVAANGRYRGAGEGMTVDCPKLIDRELWQRSQRNLKRRTRGTSPKRSQQTTVLNGLVICANCGKPMYANGKPSGKHADPSDRAYWCSTYHHHGSHKCSRNLVHERALLDYLLPRVQSILLSPASMAQLEQSLRQKVGKRKPATDGAAVRKQAAALDADIAAAVRELKRVPDDLYDLAVADLRDLRKRREALNASLAATSGTGKAGASDTEVAVKAALKRAERLREALASSDPKVVRHALAELVDRIELWFERIPGKKQTRSAMTRGIIRLRVPTHLQGQASLTAQVGKLLELSFSADELGTIQRDPRRQPGVDLAATVLQKVLAAGPRAWREVLAAGRRAGVSPNTIRRAGERLGVTRGKGGVWSFRQSAETAI